MRIVNEEKTSSFNVYRKNRIQTYFNSCRSFQTTLQIGPYFVNSAVEFINFNKMSKISQKEYLKKYLTSDDKLKKKKKKSKDKLNVKKGVT
jgi:hypothetical protein